MGEEIAGDLIDDHADKTNGGKGTRNAQLDRRQVFVAAMAAAIMIGAADDFAAESGSACTKPTASVPTRLVVNGMLHTLQLECAIRLASSREKYGVGSV